MPDIAMQMPGIASEVAEIFRMCVGHSGYVPRYVPQQLTRGYAVDVIEEIGSPWWDEEWNHARYLSCLSQVKFLWRLSKLKGQPIYESPERREQALWHVPIGDLYWTSA